MVEPESAITCSGCGKLFRENKMVKCYNCGKSNCPKCAARVE